MECNKEEAIRAKDIAEKKMQMKDFLGAHMIALKAQKLYPDLDNMSQMLVVCEVHCSAEHKICGDMMDWYSILQICQTADEGTIKKQYRKLALLLHPDKNNLPGAEAAFKLIGNAQTVLTDQRLRSSFDVIYNHKKPSDTQKKVSKQYQHRKPPPTQQTQPANTKTNKTFWTMCSFCYVKFQYYTDVLNKLLRCQCCSKPFVACDISAECIPPRSKNDKNSACSLQEAPGHGFFKVMPQRANDNSSSVGDFKWKFGCKDSETESFWKTRCPLEASVASKKGVKYVSVNLKYGGEVESDKVKQSSKLNRKRGVQVRKTCDAGSRRDPDDIIIEKGDIPPQSTNESFRKRQCTPKTHAASKTCGKCESVDVKVSCEEESNKIMSAKVNGKRRDPDEIILEKDGVLPQSTNGSSKEHYPRRSPRNKHVSYNKQFDYYPKRARRSMPPYFNEGENVHKASEMNCVHGLSSTTEENKNEGTQAKMAFEESLSHVNIDTKDTDEEKTEESVIKSFSENEDESLKVERRMINGSHGLAATTEENQKHGVQGKKASGESLFNGNSNIESDNKETVDNVMKNFSEDFNGSASNVAKPEAEIIVLDTPDFSNFCKGDKCFENGQIWACYDCWDGMPRFYARIQRVFFPGFKVEISWLVANPDDKDEIEWVNEELPVSCGKFEVCSTTESIEDPFTFSHLVSWDKGCMQKSFSVYPKTGETWALYKDWDIKWKSGMDRMTVQYEYVEILSDYVEGLGACVAKLGKLKDFTCLFCKLVQGPHSYFQIPSTELYRFSHQVPSYRMTGEEREGVPRGSFELDPGSLPLNLSDIPVVENYEMEIEQTKFSGLCQDLPIGMGYNGGVHLVEREDNSNVKDQSSENDQKSVEANYPNAELYDFDADRPMEQFQAGQIWALYCDEDAMPKVYGLIKKIESPPSFQVHIEWLTADLLKDMVPWRDKKMLMSCGKFFSKGDEPQIYATICAFSHPVRAVFKKGEYIIVPRKGEVWALYKQWNVNMTCSDLLNCEYEIVEIHEVKHMWRKVLALECVAGFNTVFKAQVRENKPVMMEIHGHQMLRFSHLIPSFKQRRKRDESLNGFWELDPASLPVAFSKPI